MLEAVGMAWLAGGIAFLVYCKTMCRTIYVGDSGELAAAVHTLGIPHPPGYPLYVLLGKLFSIVVPIGRPALRLNIFSAVCSSLSVVLLTRTVMLFTHSPSASVAIGLTWAFSASLWSQSGIARVYALGALITALSTYLAACWYWEPESYGWMYAAILVGALGLANHTVAVVQLPALFLLALGHRPQVLLDPVVWIVSILMCVPGPMLYLWIYWRLKSKPAVYWGNVENWSDFVRFVLRKDYWQYRYVHSLSDAVEVVWFYTRRVLVEFGFVGAAVLLVGVVCLPKMPLGILLYVMALVLLNAAAVIAHARREDIFHWTRYMITAWFALMIPMAWGAMLLLAPAARFITSEYLAFLLPLVAFLANYRTCDLSGHRLAEEYNRRLLEAVPEGATLIAQDDNVVFPIMYLRHAEGVRPDIRLLASGVSRPENLHFDPRKDVVCCTHWDRSFNFAATAEAPGLQLIAEGLVFRAVATDMDFQPRDFWSNFGWRELVESAQPANYLSRCLLSEAYFRHGQWIAKRDFAAAAGWYLMAIEKAPDSPTLAFNVGLVYRQHGLESAAQVQIETACRIDRTFREKAERL